MITGPQRLKRRTDNRHKRDGGSCNPGKTEAVEHAAGHRNTISIRLLRLASRRAHMMITIGHGHRRSRHLRRTGKTGCRRQHCHRHIDKNHQDHFCDTHPKPLLSRLNSHVNDNWSLINVKAADHSKQSTVVCALLRKISMTTNDAEIKSAHQAQKRALLTHSPDFTPQQIAFSARDRA